MSLRDEIEIKLGEYTTGFKAKLMADALLPIVERVAREVGDLAERKMLEILASGRAGWLCGLMPHEIDDIVRRVMEGGQ